MYAAENHIQLLKNNLSNENIGTGETNAAFGTPCFSLYVIYMQIILPEVHHISYFLGENGHSEIRRPTRVRTVPAIA